MDDLSQQPTPESVTDPRFHGTTSRFHAWSWREDVWLSGADLVGYRIRATDGEIGTVDRASHDVDSAYLVVDTGGWLTHRKVMLPAGTVSHIDHEQRAVHVDRTGDQIKAAPEYDEASHADQGYRDRLGGYYDDSYAAIPPGTGR
jgi:hypothetical protein